MLFLASDTYLLTTGSRDICILQWAVEGKLPAVNEEEEYDMDNEVAHAGRRQKAKHVPSDNESYHSEGSAGIHEEEDNYEYSKNVARGRQARGRQRVYDNSHSEDSLSHQAPQDHERPSRRSRHLSHQEEDDSRAVGRSPRRNIPSQDTRSQQGSYAARFNKHKAANNTRWNPQTSNYPQQEPEDMSHYSDEESPRQHQGHGVRGRGRGRHPARGQDRQWDRRPMR